MSPLLPAPGGPPAPGLAMVFRDPPNTPATTRLMDRLFPALMGLPVVVGPRTNESAGIANGQTQQAAPAPPPSGAIEGDGGDSGHPHTGHNNLVPSDAATAGRQAAGRFRALCGTEVLPAALVDPGTGYCWPCRSTTIPGPRAGR
ncbi:MAG TPA: hypothetical protein VF734_04610 [Pseudonocardiaceae bacterium]